jgi:hypothetical protein
METPQANKPQPELSAYIKKPTATAPSLPCQDAAVFEQLHTGRWRFAVDVRSLVRVQTLNPAGFAGFSFTVPENIAMH